MPRLDALDIFAFAMLFCSCSLLAICSIDPWLTKLRSHIARLSQAAKKLAQSPVEKEQEDTVGTEKEDEGQDENSKAKTDEIRHNASPYTAKREDKVEDSKANEEKTQHDASLPTVPADIPGLLHVMGKPYQASVEEESEGMTESHPAAEAEHFDTIEEETRRNASPPAAKEADKDEGSNAHEGETQHDASSSASPIVTDLHRDTAMELTTLAEKLSATLITGLPPALRQRLAERGDTPSFPLICIPPVPGGNKREWAFKFTVPYD